MHVSIIPNKNLIINLISSNKTRQISDIKQRFFDNRNKKDKNINWGEFISIIGTAGEIGQNQHYYLFLLQQFGNDEGSGTIS